MLSIFTKVPSGFLRFSPISFRLGFTMAQNLSTRFDPKFYDKSGKDIGQDGFFENLSKFVSRVKETDHAKGVLLIGENHMDPEAHRLELKILEKVSSAAEAEKIKLGFSLEFYDRAGQPIVDEYLAGFFDYDALMSELGSGAPHNHEDYKPLLEFCRNSGIPALASNCPRRYSKLVAKHGAEILSTLPEKSRNFLAPLPFRKPSDAYTKNFLRAMQIVHVDDVIISEKMSRMLDAQTLWDATMAFSIDESFDSVDLVAHVSGYFHVRNDLGIIEHLRHRRKDILSESVVMFPEESPNFSSENHLGSADTIILTDLNQVI